MELFQSEVYQEITRRAAHDIDWASYLLLLELGKKIVESFPRDLEGLNILDIKRVEIDLLEAVGKTVASVLTGGVDEFAEYMPPVRRRKQRV